MPVSQPCAHLNDAKTATSCSDRSSTNHTAPEADGVPTISPLSSRHVAAPRGCQPEMLVPLRLPSGVNEGPAVFKGTDNSARDQIATSAVVDRRAISNLVQFMSCVTSARRDFAAGTIALSRCYKGPQRRVRHYRTDHSISPGTGLLQVHDGAAHLAEVRQRRGYVLIQEPDSEGENRRHCRS